MSTEAMDESKMDTLEGTVFDEMIKLFEHMKNDMLVNNIVSYVCDDVKARSRPYRKDKWVEKYRTNSETNLLTGKVQPLLTAKITLPHIDPVL